MTLDRHNDSFLSRWEAVLLIAMARRLPQAVGPNHLTAFGVFGALVVLVGGLLAQINIAFLWLVNLGLVLHWLGDSLDGTLARVRKTERPRFGFFLDQMTDVLTNLVIALGVGLAGFARLDITLLVLVGYQMLGMFVLIQSAATGRFFVSIGGLGPTEVRLVIVVLTLLVMGFGAPPILLFGAAFTWCDGVMLAGFGVMLALFASSFVAEGRRIGRDDPGA
jgi:phosphatidylglycerophosphate synthase